MTDNSDEQITDLQMRIAFLENNVEEMNQVITQQQAQITLLERALKHINSRLDEVGSSQIKGADEETPPPHY
ncbi:SlyX family protein [Bermanella marisrubri]|uniref:Protein SlyX homolog n=1 Tax=Bermanella marisrubri TaxID=207949 RepID=Q1N1Z1_9GAMM|nr:SlyX family protein [Bermanella marisrubri]EAT12140.1 hypothetical protein RED65_03920 [Oceanobacter sp. RED65] [Bermanella marisrubri]QIZ83618.1 SlyX family protein [Bermanella marisrubri]